MGSNASKSYTRTVAIVAVVGTLVVVAALVIPAVSVRSQSRNQELYYIDQSGTAHRVVVSRGVLGDSTAGSRRPILRSRALGRLVYKHALGYCTDSELEQLQVQVGRKKSANIQILLHDVQGVYLLEVVDQYTLWAEDDAFDVLADGREAAWRAILRTSWVTVALYFPATDKNPKPHDLDLDKVLAVLKSFEGLDVADSALEQVLHNKEETGVRYCLDVYLDSGTVSPTPTVGPDRGAVRSVQWAGPGAVESLYWVLWEAVVLGADLSADANVERSLANAFAREYLQQVQPSEPQQVESALSNLATPSGGSSTANPLWLVQLARCELKGGVGKVVAGELYVQERSADALLEVGVLNARAFLGDTNSWHTAPDVRDAAIAYCSIKFQVADTHVSVGSTGYPTYVLDRLTSRRDGTSTLLYFPTAGACNFQEAVSVENARAALVYCAPREAAVEVYYFDKKKEVHWQAGAVLVVALGTAAPVEELSEAWQLVYVDTDGQRLPVQWLHDDLPYAPPSAPLARVGPLARRNRPFEPVASRLAWWNAQVQRYAEFVAEPEWALFDSAEPGRTKLVLHVVREGSEGNRCFAERTDEHTVWAKDLYPELPGARRGMVWRAVVHSAWLKVVLHYRPTLAKPSPFVTLNGARDFYDAVAEVLYYFAACVAAPPADSLSPQVGTRGAYDLYLDENKRDGDVSFKHASISASYPRAGLAVVQFYWLYLVIRAWGLEEPDAVSSLFAAYSHEVGIPWVPWDAAVRVAQLGESLLTGGGAQRLDLLQVVNTYAHRVTVAELLRDAAFVSAANAYAPLFEVGTALAAAALGHDVELLPLDVQVAARKTSWRKHEWQAGESIESLATGWVTSSPALACTLVQLVWTGERLLTVSPSGLAAVVAGAWRAAVVWRTSTNEFDCRELSEPASGATEVTVVAAIVVVVVNAPRGAKWRALQTGPVAQTRLFPVRGVDLPWRTPLVLERPSGQRWYALGNVLYRDGEQQHTFEGRVHSLLFAGTTLVINTVRGLYRRIPSGEFNALQSSDGKELSNGYYFADVHSSGPVVAALVHTAEDYLAKKVVASGLYWWNDVGKGLAAQRVTVSPDVDARDRGELVADGAGRTAFLLWRHSTRSVQLLSLHPDGDHSTVLQLWEAARSQELGPQEGVVALHHSPNTGWVAEVATTVGPPYTAYTPSRLWVGSTDSQKWSFHSLLHSHEGQLQWTNPTGVAFDRNYLVYGASALDPTVRSSSVWYSGNFGETWFQGKVEAAYVTGLVVDRTSNVQWVASTLEGQHELVFLESRRAAVFEL